MTPLIALFLVATAPHAALAADPGTPAVMQFQGTQEVDSIAADSDGNVYIGDVVAGQIGKYSPAGNLLMVEGQGDDTDAVGYPVSLAVSSDGRLAVADDDDSALWLFTPGGSLQAGIGVSGADQDSPQGLLQNSHAALNQPEGGAFGPKNSVYVADTNNNRVAVYDSATGSFLFSWSNAGPVSGTSLCYPTGVFVLAGKVYVADSGSSRVLVYDASGNFLQAMGGHGAGAGKFISLFAVTADGLGRVWAADEALNKVSVFNADGSLLTEYGTAAQGPAFQELTSINTGPDGTVLVGDGNSNNVYLWRTGVAIQPYGLAKAPTPTPTPKSAAPSTHAANLELQNLAFGPVPAKAGESLTLRLPASADSIHWELYTCDMRMVAQGTEYSRNEVVFSQTAALASGIYIARVEASADGISRQSVQKLILTR